MSDDQPTTLDPATFDLDSWIAGVVPLRQTVPVYSRGDLQPRIDELVERIQSLEPAADRTLADRPEREALVDELRGLWREYEASSIVVELEQLSADSLEEATRAAHEAVPMPSGGELTPQEYERVNMERNSRMGMEVLARSIKAAGPPNGPRVKVTAEQVDALSRRVGVAEFSRLTEAAQNLTFNGRVDAPFSQRVSDILTGPHTG